MNKPTLAILLFEQVEVLDFAGPFEVFSVADELHNFSLFNVITVSHTTKQINSVNGLKVTADYNFENCPKLIDYLVLPGGDGTKLAHTYDPYRSWVNTHFHASTEVLTVCSGIRFLASLGLLGDIPYCTHQVVYPAIRALAADANPQPQLRYIKSGKLTSAGGISAGIDASFSVLERIAGKSVAERTAQYMEYHRNEADCSNYWR